MFKIACATILCFKTNQSLFVSSMKVNCNSQNKYQLEISFVLQHVISMYRYSVAIDNETLYDVNIYFIMIFFISMQFSVNDFPINLTAVNIRHAEVH